MVRLVSSLAIAATGMVVLAAGAGAQVAPPKGGDPQPVSISFRNETKTTLVVQGASRGKGNIERRGQPIVIKDGKTGYDNNVPPGPRKVTIIDYNTNRTLLLNFPFLVPQGRDLQLVIRTSPTNPNAIILSQDQ